MTIKEKEALLDEVFGHLEQATIAMMQYRQKAYETRQVQSSQLKVISFPVASKKTNKNSKETQR